LGVGRKVYVRKAIGEGTEMRGTKEPVNSNVDSMPNRTFDLEIGEVVVIKRRAVPIRCY
jgi:hypothetical protein